MRRISGSRPGQARSVSTAWGGFGALALLAASAVPALSLADAADGPHDAAPAVLAAPLPIPAGAAEPDSGAETPAEPQAESASDVGSAAESEPPSPSPDDAAADPRLADSEAAPSRASDPAATALQDTAVDPDPVDPADAASPAAASAEAPTKAATEDSTEHSTPAVAAAAPEPVADSPLAAAYAALRAGRERWFHQRWAAQPVLPTPAERDAARARADAALAAGEIDTALLLAARLQADAMLDARPTRGDDAARLAQAAAEAGLGSIARAALRDARSAAVQRRADAIVAVAGRLMADGDAAGAVEVLTEMPPRQTALQRNRAALIEARALLELARPRDAAQVLQGALYDPIRLIGAPSDKRLRAATTQYDLALALIEAGDEARGRALLERLGRRPAPEPIEQALVDRANLALGNRLLRDRQGAGARAVFERIALDGPYSNRALLGMGWAALAPQGDKPGAKIGIDDGRRGDEPKFVLRVMQRRRLIDCADVNRRALAPTELCRRQQRLETAPVPSGAAGLAYEALLVWNALAARDRRDPAVREAIAGLGHAAALAGLRDDAVAMHEEAATLLDAALAANLEAGTRLASEAFDAAVAAAVADAATEPPGRALPIARIAAFELALGTDGQPGRAERERLLTALRDLHWLRAQASDAVDAAAEPALLDALRDAAAVALATEREQLLGWLLPVRASLATLSDPSYRLPLPDAPAPP